MNSEENFEEIWIGMRIKIGREILFALKIYEIDILSERFEQNL